MHLITVFGHRSYGYLFLNVQQHLSRTKMDCVYYIYNKQFLIVNESMTLISYRLVVI